MSVPTAVSAAMSASSPMAKDREDSWRRDWRHSCRGKDGGEPPALEAARGGSELRPLVLAGPQACRPRLGCNAVRPLWRPAVEAECHKTLPVVLSTQVYLLSFLLQVAVVRAFFETAGRGVSKPGCGRDLQPSPAWTGLEIGLPHALQQAPQAFTVILTNNRAKLCFNYTTVIMRSDTVAVTIGRQKNYRSSVCECLRGFARLQSKWNCSAFQG